MIPILYESNEKKFESTGLGLLTDCTSCVVSEERNGTYSCEFEYPKSGINFEEIKVGRIIACTHDDAGDIQPFLIYKREVPDVYGKVKFYAYHISYLLSNIVVMPFEAYTVYEALKSIKDYSANANPFTFYTDKSLAKLFSNNTPRLARNMLGGEDNSILDVYDGGEYEFDKFNVNLYSSRGKDSGVTIQYGINLISLNQSIDNASTYNAVAPYWKDTEGNAVYLPEGIVVMDEAVGSRIDAIPLDLSDKFQEEKPTVEELREKAKAAIKSGKAWKPTENLKVDFVQLWQTEEYKNFASLQKVRLCDTVTVLYPVLGISEVKQKVIKTVFNVLLDRYDSVELGTLQTTLGKAIESQILDVVPTKEEVANTVRYESDLLRGGKGGYIVLRPGENRYPEEILIMDTPDIDTANNIIRLNKGGIAFSQNGQAGPYSSAWSIDGTFMANFIRSGILSDSAGINRWNLDTGNLTTRSLYALDSLYIDGNNETFFRIPFGLNEEEEARGSLQLSNVGFMIEVGKSNIRNISIGSGGNYPNLPDNNSSEGLTWEYVDDTGGWHTTVTPTYVSISGEKYTGYHYVTEAAPGSIDISGNGEGLIIDTATRSYGLNVGTGDAAFDITGDTVINGNFRVTGTKSRTVKTENFADKLLYAYETPSPTFGDIGEATLDEEGICYVTIDDIFAETIATECEYQVFLQKEGEGDCWIAEKTPHYFIIQGSPGLNVAWELKAKQKGYESLRLEDSLEALDMYEKAVDPMPLFNDILDDLLMYEEEGEDGYY